MSVWKDGSDVVRLNTNAGVGPVHVSPETLEVLEIAHDASVQTHGKFDITFGALADIWKFDHDQDNSIPDRSAIDKRLPLVNYEEVRDQSRREAGPSSASPACACTWAASARATRSIARSRCSSSRSSPTS